MFPKMHGDTSLADIEAISQFETNREIVFPSLYRDFLVAKNGGIPDLKYYPIVGMHLNPFGGIQLFFGLNKKIQHYSLEEAYDLYAGGIPHGIVPIADDGGGNYVCLDLRNGKERVAYWDKRHFWGTGQWRESDLYRVADTFAEFLTSLKATLG
jgi:cell wall assembly regulator SMI1